MLSWSCHLGVLVHVLDLSAKVEGVQICGLFAQTADSCHLKTFFAGVLSCLFTSTFAGLTWYLYIGLLFQGQVLATIFESDCFGTEGVAPKGTSTHTTPQQCRSNKVHRFNGKPHEINTLVPTLHCSKFCKKWKKVIFSCWVLTTFHNYYTLT